MKMLRVCMDRTKPDIRFGMTFVEMNELTQQKNFVVFDSAELVVGICAKGCADFSRKKLDKLTDFVKRPAAWC